MVLCESESHSIVSNSLWPHGLYSLWNSPGQNTGAGSLSLLQWIFPTQGSNPGLPHCRQILYQLSHKGSPRILEWVAYPFSSGSSLLRNWTRVYCIAGGFFTNWAIRELCTFIIFCIITIHLQVSSSSSQAETLSPLNIKPHLSSSQPLATHHSTLCLYNLASYEWNHTVLVLLWLVSFIEHNILKVHSCCSMCLDFLPSQSHTTSHWIFGLSSFIAGCLDCFPVTFQLFHQQGTRVPCSLSPCHHLSSLLLLKIILFIYLLAVLGLHCCLGFSLVGVSRGYSLVVAHRLLLVVAFRCGARAQGRESFSSGGTWAQ